MRPALTIVLVVMSCAPPDSQRSYTYPGCESGGPYCPNSRTFECAVESIRGKYTACQTTADCVLAPLSTCFEGCSGPSVNDAGAFLSEALIEVHRYCDDARCSGGASCVGTFVAECRAGNCIAAQK